MTQEQFGTTVPVFNKLFYNSRGQLSEIRESTTANDSSWNRGAIINQYSFQCWGAACNGTDNNGNLKKQEMYVPADDQISSYTSWHQQYAYDNLNRLIQVNEYTGDPTKNWQQAYTIDRYGNRTIDVSNTSPNIPRPAFNVDASTNRLTVAAGYSGAMAYDAVGNLYNDSYTSTGSRTFDAENRLTSAQNSPYWTYYTYDGEGRRVRRKINNVETWQIYGLGGELLAEYSANAAATAPQKEYGYRNGQLLVTAEPAAQINWLVADQLGTPRMIFDRTGRLDGVSRHDYLPFGEELFANTGLRSAGTGYGGSDNVRQKFTGYERDSETGLDFAQARYCSSAMGRFTSVDPLSGEPHRPQSWNRYAYVLNNPLKLTDPSGMVPVPAHGGVGIGGEWFLPLRPDPGVYGDLYSATKWDATIEAWVQMETDLLMAETTLPQNPTPQRNAQLDQKVAGIFGGEGAVSTASGFEPPNILNGVYRGDTTGDNGQPVYGHLGSRAMHLYGGDPPGTGTTGVYLPPGYTALYANPQTLPEYRGGSFVAFYPNLNGLHNVSIIATHVAGFTRSSSERNAAGSIYIGTTGGRGASPSNNPNYIHSHFELVQGRVVRGRSTTAMPHISFANAFVNRR